MHCSMPGFPVLHHLLSFLKLLSIELVIPSNHLINCLWSIKYKWEQWVWWLILYVNLTGPWAAQTFSQTLFWVHLGECFWLRRTSESVDWIKHMAFPNVDELINQRHEQNRDWIRGNLSLWSWRAGQADQLSTQCLSDCWAGISVFFCSWAEIDTFSSPEYPACQFQILGLHILYNHVTQLIYILLVLFLWRILANIPTLLERPVASLLAFIKQRYGFKKLFIYLLAALGLHCCMQVFSSWGEWVLPFIAACRLLLTVASLILERGLQVQELQYLWPVGLVALLRVKSSQTRDWTCVPWISRRILYHWTTREVQRFVFDGR